MSFLRIACGVTFLTLLGCGGGDPIPPPPMPEIGEVVTISEDPGHQFDFWLGEWDVLNKHLRGGAWVDSGVGVALIQSVAGGNGKPGIRWLDGEVAGDSVTFLGTTGSISLREKWVLVDGKVLEFERSESADPDQGWISVLRTQFEPTAVQNP